MSHEHHLRVARTARYYTLGPADMPVRELWFVLHGYGHLASRFLRTFADLDDGTRLLVAPEALNRFYLGGVDRVPAHERPVGATWMTREDRETEINDYVEFLDAVAGDVTARLPAGIAALDRVVVLGFSQGTATAARWVASGTLRPHDVVLWGGLLPPELDLGDPAHPLRRAQLTFVVGDADEYANAAAVAGQEERLRAKEVPYGLRRFTGGHAVDRAALLALAAALGNAAAR